MKVFLLSCIVAVVIAAASQFVLTRYVGESSERAFSAASARPE